MKDKSLSSEESFNLDADPNLAIRNRNILKFINNDAKINPVLNLKKQGNCS